MIIAIAKVFVVSQNRKGTHMDMKVGLGSSSPIAPGSTTNAVGGLAISQLATRAMHAAKAGHHHAKTSSHASNKNGIDASNSSEGSTTAASDAAASFVNFLQNAEVVNKQPAKSTVGASVQENFLANSVYTQTTQSVLANKS